MFSNCEMKYLALIGINAGLALAGGQFSKADPTKSNSAKRVTWSGLPENIDSKSGNLGMKGKGVKPRSSRNEMFFGVSNNNQDLGSVGLKKGLPKPIPMKDNRWWYPIDGPIFLNNDQIAQWVMFKRINSPAPNPEHAFTQNSRISATSNDHLIPDNEFFDLSYSPGGNSSWGPLVGPIPSGDKLSTHWFRARLSSDQSKSQNYIEFIKNANSIRSMMKDSF